MKRFKLYIGLLLIPFCVFISCKEEDTIIDNPSGETIIYTLRINNGDITGAGRYDGIVNQENKTISFLIPAESDIEQLKFDGRLSLNAKLDAESYNFLENSTQTIRVINVENSSEYRVNIAMNDPAVTPFVDKIVVVLNDGTEVSAFVSMTDKTIYLKAPNENEVTVKSLSSKPVRATKTFTKIANSKISKADPGKIQLDFMGLTDEYQISFDDIPTFGADFNKGNIFDFSLNPLGNAIYPDFVSNFTRSADFDGKHMLIISRTGGNKPHLFTLADIVAGNTSNPKMLDLTGVVGGTYLISAGRLVQERIYICNLTTGIANTAAGKLKVYYWATPASVPKLILDFDGKVSASTAATGRYGDNMSVNIDENGNGYIYCVEHAAGNNILRFTVTNFETVSEPAYFTSPVAASYFASYNQVGSNNEYILTSSKVPLVLVDKDGKELFKLASDALPLQLADARIISYNFERYLIGTTGRATTAQANQTFYVYDLSTGIDVVSALSEFSSRSDKTPLYMFSLQGNSIDAYASSTGWGIVDNKLYLMGAATNAGFAVFEFPKK